MIRALAAFILAATVISSAPVLAQETPHTIIGVDVSGSSTFLVDQTSADAAGEFVEKYIAGLDAPHRIDLISVGDAGLARRIIDVQATVTKNRASSARRLAPQFGALLRGLPAMIERGEIAAQGTTSLIDFFQSLEPICEAGGATIVLFSDAVEWSSTIDGRAFASGKVKLPKPESTFLKGCTVKLLGVGQLKNGSDSNGLAERLIPQWKAFLIEAGAEPVSVIASNFAL